MKQKMYSLSVVKVWSVNSKLELILFTPFDVHLF